MCDDIRGVCVCVKECNVCGLPFLLSSRFSQEVPADRLSPGREEGEHSKEVNRGGEEKGEEGEEEREEEREEENRRVEEEKKSGGERRGGGREEEEEGGRRRSEEDGEGRTREQKTQHQK